MKIAVVEPSGKGGLIHYAFQLCNAMEREGASVTLITDRHYELESLSHAFTVERRLRLWDPKPVRETLSPALHGLRRAGRAAIYYREWGRLLRYLRKLRPDVVQFGDIRFATDIAPLTLARSSCRIMADICHNVRPFASAGHAAGSFDVSRLGRALYQRLYARFDSIFVHYAVNTAEFARTFPASASRVVPIVHGNEEIFRELRSPEVTVRGLRHELRLRESDRVVLFFGALSRYKGLDLLLDAFTRIARAVPEAVLVIAGYPLPDFRSDEYLAHAAADIAERVRLVPRYVDAGAVCAWMELADVITFPYREVFQSGALHVAQTFGVPIVTTRVGAMAEVIVDRETGLLVEPDDASLFAAAVIELLSDRSLAARLGHAAAADAIIRFSWSSIASKILAEYESRLSRGRR